MPRVVLYRRGADVDELVGELEEEYGARRGTHYTVEDRPRDGLNVEDGVPAVGVEQDLIEGEIHHVGEDIILQAFGAFRLDDLEEALEEG